MAGCGQRCPACPVRSSVPGHGRHPARRQECGTGPLRAHSPADTLVKRLTRQMGTLSLRLNSDSELPEVESAGFHRGSFGGTGSGVADEHVGAGPAGDGHESGLGAACGEPAVRRGVPQPVGTEALDAGAHGSASQRAREAFAAELLAAIGQPESGEGGGGQQHDVCRQRPARLAGRQGVHDPRGAVAAGLNPDVAPTSDPAAVPGSTSSKVVSIITSSRRSGAARPASCSRTTTRPPCSLRSGWLQTAVRCLRRR
jgi:hypothetical protein